MKSKVITVMPAYNAATTLKKKPLRIPPYFTEAPYSTI